MYQISDRVLMPGKRHCYSIIWSARASSAAGIVTPSTLGWIATAVTFTATVVCLAVRWFL
jgi:hypothetical protein